MSEGRKMAMTEEELLKRINETDEIDWEKRIKRLRRVCERYLWQSKIDDGPIGAIKFYIQEAFDFRSKEKWDRDEQAWVEQANMGNKILSSDKDVDCDYF